MKRVPLPENAGEITAEGMQQALAAGGASDFPKLDSLVVEKLSEATNALGNLCGYKAYTFLLGMRKRRGR